MEKIYLMHFKEANCPYGDEPFECNILIKSNLNKKEIKKIMKEVDTIKNRDPYADVDETEWDNIEDNPYEDLGWDESIYEILRTQFNDKITILDAENVSGLVN